MSYNFMNIIFIYLVSELVIKTQFSGLLQTKNTVSKKSYVQCSTRHSCHQTIFKLQSFNEQGLNAL